jgi:hypothetical protein
MKPQQDSQERHDDLPNCVSAFLTELIKHIRYRRKVREDIRDELRAHFVDELRACTSQGDRQKKAEEVIAGFGDPKLLATLLRRAKRRCRPAWQTAVVRTVQVVAVLVVCFVAYVVWFLAGKPVVTTDYVAQFNRLVRPPADEGLNAATFYTRAAEMIAEPPSGILDMLKSEHDALGAEQRQRLAGWLAARQQMFDLLAEGARRRHYWRTYEGEEGMLSVLLPYVRSYGYLAHALGHRAEFLADEGRQDDALAMVQVCYRHGRHLRAGNKSLIEQIRGMRIEDVATDALLGILSRHRLKPAELAELQEGLEGLFEDEDFRVNLARERLMVYDEIQRCFTAGGPTGEHLYPRRLASLSHSGDERTGIVVYDFVTTPRRWGTVAKVLFAHPDKEETRATFDRAYDSVNDWLRKTPIQLRAEGIDINDEMERMVKGNVLLEVMIPVLGRVHRFSYQTEVRFDAALTVVALLRYEVEKGGYPENLAELVAAGYLQRPPLDAWSTGPLTYRRTGDDFLLYGWGENFTDDGGRRAADDEGGGRSAWSDDGDWVFWPVAREPI